MASAAHQVAALYEEAGWQAVEATVSDGRSESLYLEFKRKQNPATGSFDTEDRRHFSEALSGFANSEGGVVIWGIDARRQGEDDRAVGISMLRDVRRFVAELTQLTPEMVSPAVSGVRHVPILAPGEDNAGVVLTLIPESDFTPHMARGKGMQRYYRRSGDSFRPLEHYEVADLFGRRAHPVVRGRMRWSTGISVTGGGHATARIVVSLGIENTGRGLARYPAITMKKPEGYHISHWPGRYVVSGLFVPIQAPEGWWIRLAAGSDVVIYPGDEVAIGEVVLEISNRATTVPDLRMIVKVVAAEAQPDEEELHVTGEELLLPLTKNFTEAGYPFAAAQVG